MATSFADLIYRESEIDALWSLVDIQVTAAEHSGSATELARLAGLRSRLWEAHDLVPEGRCRESAAILRELVQTW
ncbi:hypothetical protein LRP67_09455 [Nocardioides sp. cx-169]|uniref:hypothetical protein n=1 Tax=Nocardioides sp. cx-169 TaxID=2899080 RepID=UPI001E626EC1|nr:hypothetical protein [Nocardioides sp. cx-169]MCD4534306.1 hypothetical protein [Nocardioides sp. cx-169]